jgi:hypothetical protein
MASNLSEIEIPDTLNERMQKVKDNPDECMLNPNDPVCNFDFLNLLMLDFLKKIWSPEYHEKARREIAWVCRLAI